MLYYFRGFTCLLLGCFPLLLGCYISKNQNIKSSFDWNLEAQNLIFYANSATPLPDQMLMSSDIQRILPPGSSANLIQLNGNSNFVIFSKDSIKSYLPYFGRVFMTNSINSQQSPLELISTRFQTKKETIKKNVTYVEWKFEDQRDLNQMTISVSQDGYATLHCRFNFRQPISFYGKISKK